MQQRWIITIIIIAIGVSLFIFMIWGFFEGKSLNKTGDPLPVVPVTTMPNEEQKGSPVQAQPLWIYPFPSGDRVQAVSVDGDGTAIVAGTRYSHLYSFNRTGMVVWFKNGITDHQAISDVSQDADGIYGIQDIVVSADGNYTGIVSALGQNAYYYRNGTPVWGDDWSIVESQGKNVATSDDGHFFTVGTGYSHNNFVILYDLQSLKEYYFRGALCHDTWHYHTYDSVRDSGLDHPHDPHDGTGVHVAISADGQHVAAVSEDSRVYYFNRAGSLLWINITGRALENVAMSANGDYIAVASRDHTVYFFNASGTRLWNYHTEGVVKSVALNADGNYIAAGSEDSRVYLFNRNGTMLWEFATGGLCYLRFCLSSLYRFYRQAFYKCASLSQENGYGGYRERVIMR